MVEWNRFLDTAKAAATGLAIVPQGRFQEQDITSSDLLRALDTAWEAVLKGRAGSVIAADAAMRLRMHLLDARTCQALAELAADRERGLQPRVAERWQSSIDAAAAEWRALTAWLRNRQAQSSEAPARW
jgi:hypothetical protein